jgi:hypothetical protein
MSQRRTEDLIESLANRIGALIARDEYAQREAEREERFVFSKLLKDATTSNGELRYTLGVAYAPNELDAHSEWVGSDELRKCAWSAALRTVKADTMHNEEPAGVIVESWLSPIDFEMKDVTGAIQSVPKGAWMIGTVWTSKAFDAIKAGRLKGLSIAGLGVSKPNALPDEE